MKLNTPLPCLFPLNRWSATAGRLGGWLALAAGMLAARPAHAQQTLPFYEPFPAAYVPGELGQNGASQAAVWSLGNSAGTGSADVNGAAALSYSGLQTTTGSQGLYVCPTTSNRNKGIAFTATTSGTLFASFLMNVQSAPAATSLFAAISSATSSSPGSSAHGIWLNTANQLQISKRSSTTPVAATTAALTPGTHLVVWSYTYNSSSDDDIVSLWLDPAANTLGGTAPAATLSTGTGVSDSTTLQGLYLCNLSNSNRFFLDELRLGTTWASVTPTAGAAAATALAFTASPGYAATGATLSPATVQVVDQYGNPFAAANVPVTLAVTTGTLGGTATKNTDANGQATFSNLSVSTAAVEQLTASGGGLTAGTSDYFSILTGTSSGGSTPTITTVSAIGGNLSLSGTGGQASQPYTVIATANPANKLSTWSTVGGSSFDSGGNFDFSSALSAGTPNQYYAVKYTPSGGGGPVSLPAFARMGYANSNNVTGGAGGIVVTATDYPSLSNYCRLDLPLIINVQGTITGPGPAVDPYCYVYSNNKSIIGVGTNASLVDVDLRPVGTNLIIRNLFFSVQPGTNDAITIQPSTTGGVTWPAELIWVDHCKFYDAQDGSLDITDGADFVTVSWCEFYYDIADNAAPCHRLVDLIGSSDTDASVEQGFEHVTMHHNWYSTDCSERMPSVRWGRVHVFDTFYDCAGNDYCIRTRLYAEVLAENNYFNAVNDPLEQYIDTNTANEPANEHGLLSAAGNIMSNCTTNYSYILTGCNPGTFVSSNSTSITFDQSGDYTIVNAGVGGDTLTDLNPPPYPYTLDPAANVPNLVRAYSGTGAVLPLP